MSTPHNGGECTSLQIRQMYQDLTKEGVVNLSKQLDLVSASIQVNNDAFYDAEEQMLMNPSLWKSIQGQALVRYAEMKTKNCARVVF